MQAAISDGEKLMTEGFNQGRWQGWEAQLTDLLRRALGPGHWPDEFRQARAAGGFDVVGEYPHETTEAEQVETRNDDVAAKLGVAAEALRAVDQDLERRGARPAEGTDLPGETFAFVAVDTTRAIAQRDYDELRVASRTVKARALLAGSVVEAVLMDALERKGFTAKQVAAWTFHELITEAQGAKVISDRTAKVAHSLRDMRNLVHPAVELREGRLSVGAAEAAVSLMRLVLEDLR